MAKLPALSQCNRIKLLQTSSTFLLRQSRDHPPNQAKLASRNRLKICWVLMALKKILLLLLLESGSVISRMAYESPSRKSRDANSCIFRPVMQHVVLLTRYCSKLLSNQRSLGRTHCVCRLCEHTRVRQTSQRTAFLVCLLACLPTCLLALQASPHFIVV